MAKVQVLMPCAFLFVTPLENEREGENIDSKLLNALKEVDPDGETHTRVYRGGLLLAQLSYKPSYIKADFATNKSSENPVILNTSYSECSDKTLYALLVGDFVETCLEQWNTLNPNTYWGNVANRSIVATFMPAISIDVAKYIDKSFRLHPSYLGAISPDLGNPLHRYLFIDMLFKDAFIRNGCVYVESGFEGDYNGSFLGADKFSTKGLVVLPYDEFENTAPTVVFPNSLSARGMVSQIRMRKRMALNIHQKLLNTLGQSQAMLTITRPIEWDLSQLPDTFEEVKVQAEKLTNYLLNPVHSKGGSKAKFFEQELSLTSQDWTYLHAQLVDELGKVVYENVSLDEYGIRFEANLPVTGLNGATATIKTAWIVRNGERASFITAIPAKKDATLEGNLISPSIVSSNLMGNNRWQAIYEMAEELAIKDMQECVPKPLVVEGQVYMEGCCGGAYIVIEDGRSKFAHWLRQKGVGQRHYPRGYSIQAKQIDQSADTAKAYADAFVQVLRRNGIKCATDCYLS